MSDQLTAHKQALSALVSELKEAGVNIDSIKEKTVAGIMGNKEYVWVTNTTIKTEAVDAINEAFGQ
ncbi:hypothetical protein NBRC116493_30300 [Aurantivibrio infirmus]